MTKYYLTLLNRLVVFIFCVILLFTIYSKYSVEKSNKYGTRLFFKNSRANYIETENEIVGLKYILLLQDIRLWTLWKLEGQRSFIKYNCLKTNCYVTHNKNLFGGDVTKFDALVFAGCRISGNNLPNVRSPIQKYIFNTMESPHYCPVFDKIFVDGFFNWTMTYKLNSDIVVPYLLIKNKTGDIVGPKQNMVWIAERHMKNIDDHLANSLMTKTKAAAWFVSRCKSQSGRELYVTDLQKHLKKYKMKVDVYGDCGRLKCRRSLKCDEMLQKDYYFYMALENSLDEDYVTEKLLRAMSNNVVPIVYGGANYSRFLPPGSYINARAYSPYELADVMSSLIRSPTAYRQYFKWKNYYTYHSAIGHNVCNLCKVMNDKDKVLAFSVHENFTQWTRKRKRQ